jgi:hypothetical protein
MKSVEKDVEQEDEATIDWSEQRRPISNYRSTDSLISNRSLSSLMTCFRTSDDTSIFIQIRGLLKIKEHAGKIAQRCLGKQAAYEESNRNYRITPNMMLT